MRHPKAILTILLALLAPVATAMAGPVSPERLFFSDPREDATSPSRIRSALLDGTDLKTVTTFLTDNPEGVAVDSDAGQLYWADAGFDSIFRSDLDGANRVQLITGLDFPSGLALDTAAGKIYWTDTQADVIQRANLDGTGVETLLSGVPRAISLALDTVHGRMFWTDVEQDAVLSATLGGADVQTLINTQDYTMTPSAPFGLVVDPLTGVLYYSDALDRSIKRAGLDGSGVTNVITGLSLPYGLALDPERELLYWANNAGDAIRRAGTDGTGLTTLITDLNGPRFIALDLHSSNVPEPAAGLLLGLGLALLATVRRRRRA